MADSPLMKSGTRIEGMDRDRGWKGTKGKGQALFICILVG